MQMCPLISNVFQMRAQNWKFAFAQGVFDVNPAPKKNADHSAASEVRVLNFSSYLIIASFGETMYFNRYMHLPRLLLDMYRVVSNLIEFVHFLTSVSVACLSVLLVCVSLMARRPAVSAPGDMFPSSEGIYGAVCAAWGKCWPILANRAGMCVPLQDNFLSSMRSSPLSLSRARALAGWLAGWLGLAGWLAFSFPPSRFPAGFPY